MKEHDKLCVLINEYLQIRNKTNKLISFHSPNELCRGFVGNIQKQKRLGMLVGIPDFGIVRDALWIEVKVGKDKLRDSQKAFNAMALRKEHNNNYVVSSFDEFLELYERYEK